MTDAKTKQTEENYNHGFETDVSKLLDIVANALYSNRDVFLRELISNAADACDRLRYEALQNTKLTKDSTPFNITITPDNNDMSLTITDNGIGMSHDDLVENLGTIARSGTSAILENLKEAGQEKDMNLIGQFGVGFYASFMVAEDVTVISQKAGEDQAHLWNSDGRTGFNIRTATLQESETLKDGHGTSITLKLKDNSIEYLLDDKINEIVLSYSDHIEVPIYLDSDITKNKEEREPINAASALWTRNKNDITEDQYREFYHHIGHFFDDPILVTHWTAEGVIEYTALLYIPSLRPWDLYDPKRKNALRLYVKKVYITDQLDTLVYPWLRFIQGVVDSQDLPLNISREMLQNNAVVHKIRNGMTKKILSEMDKLSRDNDEAFRTMWGQFGAVIKEGLYDAVEHRDQIFKVCRFSTSDHPEKQTSLDEYLERMKDGQDQIYYIAGDDANALRNSPQLEGFTSRGLEVILLTDTVDEFWLQQIPEFKGKKFQSVTKGHVDLEKFDETKDNTETKDDEQANDSNVDTTHFIALLQTELSDQVASVRLSRRLTESPVCLVADDNAVDMNMEKVLKIHQKYSPETKRVLEINPKHKLIEKLSTMANDDLDQDILKDAARLLMDQALIIQGDNVPDPSGFARRMANFMSKGLV